MTDIEKKALALVNEVRAVPAVAFEHAGQLGIENHAIKAACIAFNSVLLNQPEDERNQPVAMQAAIRAYLAAKEAELAAVKAENERLREALEPFALLADEVEQIAQACGVHPDGVVKACTWEDLQNARAARSEQQT